MQISTTIPLNVSRNFPLPGPSRKTNCSYSSIRLRFKSGKEGAESHFPIAVMRFRGFEIGMFPHVDPRVHHVADLHGAREHAIREKTCLRAFPHEEFRDDLLRAFLR